jgi:hypothetical protein
MRSACRAATHDMLVAAGAAGADVPARILEGDGPLTVGELTAIKQHLQALM